MTSKEVLGWAIVVAMIVYMFVCLRTGKMLGNFGVVSRSDSPITFWSGIGFGILAAVIGAVLGLGWIP